MNKSSGLSYTPIVPIYFLVQDISLSFLLTPILSACLCVCLLMLFNKKLVAYSDTVAVGVIHVFCSGVLVSLLLTCGCLCLAGVHVTCWNWILTLDKNTVFEFSALNTTHWRWVSKQSALCLLSIDASEFCIPFYPQWCNKSAFRYMILAHFLCYL